MIKSIVFFNRRADLTVEAFQDYWLNRHADVVCRLPGLRRYVQSHTLLGGYRKGQPAFDGAAEVWFDSLPAMQAQVGTPAHDALIEDEHQFIDRDSMRTFLVDEHPIKDGPLPEGGVKNLEIVKAKPGMPIPAFQRYWREVHGPLGAEIPSVLRYIQNHTRLGGYAGGRVPPADGAAITWFESVDAMREGARSTAYERTRADEANFTAGHLPVIITHEHTIIA